MDDRQIEARQARQEEYWNGARLQALLGVTLAVSLAVIYFIASVKSGDFSWDPTAHDVTQNVAPSGW